MLVQIDGLSRTVLERAMRDDLTPAIASCLSGDQSRMLSLYSGLPSTTPAAQGEFFYGVRTAVPAFAFIHRDSGAMRHMLDPGAAGAVQEELESQGEALLTGGAAYCDIYTGGAESARYCPAGLARPQRALSRSARLQLRSVVGYGGVGVRALVMLAGEIARAAPHARLNRLHRVGPRLSESWNRIVASVALRDQCRLDVLDDIRRGAPIIHVNFLGYDKLAHAYGPASAPAMRALQGIDRTIRSLLDGAEQSGALRTTILIHSDHGQEATSPIRDVEGASIEEIVRDAANEIGLHRSSSDDQDADRPRHRRRLSESVAEEVGERLLGIGASKDSQTRVTTVESGPVAHIYLDAASDRAEALALKLAQRLPRLIVCWTPPGEDAKVAVGQDRFTDLSSFCQDKLAKHPFASLLAEDLSALLQHPDAGDVVVFGAGVGDAVTFAPERGGHGGVGPEETHAFAIVPSAFCEEHELTEPLRFEALRSALLDERRRAEGAPSQSP